MTTFDQQGIQPQYFNCTNSSIVACSPAKTYGFTNATYSRYFTRTSSDNIIFSLSTQPGVRRVYRTGMPAATIQSTVESSSIIHLLVSPGATGSATNLCLGTLDTPGRCIEHIRAVKNDTRIAAGIGIYTPGQIETLAAPDLNMVIIGTALLHRMNNGLDAACSFIKTVSDATVQKRPAHITV